MSPVLISQILGTSLMDLIKAHQKYVGMESYSLEPIMALCLEKKPMFKEASFFHIYMDFNKKSDMLSK
jgi:hypothetical protein